MKTSLAKIHFSLARVLQSSSDETVHPSKLRFFVDTYGVQLQWGDFPVPLQNPGRRKRYYLDPPTMVSWLDYPTLPAVRLPDRARCRVLVQSIGRGTSPFTPDAWTSPVLPGVT